MSNLLTALYLRFAGVQDIFLCEVRQIKEDERGMELLQILLIILFVVIIAAAVWLFLGDWIRGLFDAIGSPEERLPTGL